MPFEIVETRRPLRAVRREPVVDRPQRLRPHPVQPALGVGAHVDQAGVTQDPEVARDRRLAHRELPHEVSDRALALEQEIEDAATVGLGDDLERGNHARILLIHI